MTEQPIRCFSCWVNNQWDPVCLWYWLPLSLSDLFHQNFIKLLIQNLWKFIFFHLDSDDPISSQFCTCHDSSAVMTCAKVWTDLIFIFQSTATWILTRFGLWAQKTLWDESVTSVALLGASLNWNHQGKFTLIRLLEILHAVVIQLEVYLSVLVLLSQQRLPKMALTLCHGQVITSMGWNCLNVA